MIAGLSTASYQERSGFVSSGVPLVFDDDNDPDFKTNVIAALKYLKEEHPQQYSSAAYWLIEIRPTGMYTCVNDKGVCYIDTDDARASSIWLAGVLIHEARHVRDDNTYFTTASYSAEESERRAITEQAQFIAKVNGWSDDDAGRWAENYLKTKYWEKIPASYNHTSPFNIRADL